MEALRFGIEDYCITDRFMVVTAEDDDLGVADGCYGRLAARWKNWSQRLEELPTCWLSNILSGQIQYLNCVNESAVVSQAAEHVEFMI